MERAFQSTRPRGARLGVPRTSMTECEFQSTRPRGARLPERERVGHIGVVSIHAPARGATHAKAEKYVSDVFQSTRPRGARPEVEKRQAVMPLCFNPRAREGRDRVEPGGAGLPAAFQSTRPRGARRGLSLTMRWANSSFQSTRPRGARLRRNARRRQPHEVSIHAPARGATADVEDERHQRIVSIHAPARGATRSGCGGSSARGCFNPRAREGRDAGPRVAGRGVSGFNPRAREGRDSNCASTHSASADVSIHAPARGATYVPVRE